MNLKLDSTVIVQSFIAKTPAIQGEPEERQYKRTQCNSDQPTWEVYTERGDVHIWTVIENPFELDWVMNQFQQL